MYHKFLNNTFWGDKYWIKILQQWRNKWPFFPFTENHSLSLPGTIINYALPSSGELVLGIGFAAVVWFCPSCSQGRRVCDFHGWLKSLCTQGGWSEAGARASPDPGRRWRWAHSTQSDPVTTDCSKFVLRRISWNWQESLEGERSMTGRVPGRCCFLRWMEACPPRVASNTGHSSDPNYSADAGLKGKGTPSAIRKCDPPLSHPCFYTRGE